MLLRFAVTGLIFGFFTEWLLGNGKIYDNIIKKTTMRRLSTLSLTQTPRRSKTIALDNASVINSNLIARKCCDRCYSVMVLYDEQINIPLSERRSATRHRGPKQ